MVAVLRPDPGPVNANSPDDAVTTWFEEAGVVMEETVPES